MDQVAAIVLAGGRGSRVNHDLNKVYLPLDDGQMLGHSLDTMARSTMVDRVVLVAHPADLASASALISGLVPSKPVEVAEGGATRHQSERRGLEALAPAIEAEEIGLVVIHDGARPFLTLDLLETIVRRAQAGGGAIPGLSMAEPLYQADHTEVRLLSQAAIRRVQTPQAFRALPLLTAYRRAQEAGFEGVDTAETVERFSDLTVFVVPGEERNIKVTFAEDYLHARRLARQWDRGRWKDR